MAKKRKAREKVSKKVNMLKPIEPIDILKFGTEDDPCFGKHFDLTAEECKRCGDCSLCQIVMNQKTITQRKELESSNRFKDLEIDSPPRDQQIKNLISKLKKKKTAKDLILKKLIRRFNLKEKEAKKYLKEN